VSLGSNPKAINIVKENNTEMVLMIDCVGVTVGPIPRTASDPGIYKGARHPAAETALVGDHR
jgi:hypothetical protein